MLLQKNNRLLIVNRIEQKGFFSYLQCAVVVHWSLYSRMNWLRDVARVQYGGTSYNAATVIESKRVQLSIHDKDTRVHYAVIED